MRASDFRGKTKTELHKQLQELYADELKLRMQLASGNLAKNHLLREKKKAIARAKTVLTQISKAGA